jgi:AraC family transcriptional regulator
MHPRGTFIFFFVLGIYHLLSIITCVGSNLQLEIITTATKQRTTQLTIKLSISWLGQGPTRDNDPFRFTRDNDLLDFAFIVAPSALRKLVIGTGSGRKVSHKPCSLRTLPGDRLVFARRGGAASIIDLSSQNITDTRIAAFQSHDRIEADHPTVEILPVNIVRCRAITDGGMTAESVQSAGCARIEYRFRAPIHLLVVYEHGARRDGETCIEGGTRTRLGSFARKLTFVPAGRGYYEWHELRSPSRLMFLYFDPKKLKFLSDTRFANMLLTPRLFFEDESLWHTAMKLEHLIEHPALGDQCYFHALGIVIAYQLLRLHCGELSSQPPMQGGLAPWQQRIAAYYIDQHLPQRIMLSTLAHLVRQSPFHFCRAFKESFGVPPLRYQTRRRIEYAKLLLTKPEMSVTDVGLTIGFSNSSSFVTAFRKATGFTPTGYKRSLG